MSQAISRREMLLQTAVVGAGVWSTLQGSARGATRSANDKLNIAMIGCGGRGGDNLKGVASEHIVALCDEVMLAGTLARRTGEKITRCPAYLLWLHPSAICLCDREVATGLTVGETGISIHH